MKKIISLIIISLLCVGAAYGINYPGSDNFDIIGNSGGAKGISAATEVIRVRYSFQPAPGAEYTAVGLNSGDVVIWDITSADGISISGCITDEDATYAGVLVTAITSANTSNVRADTRNWGFMAVSGYCLARIDTSGATAGDALVVNGATYPASFMTAGDGSSQDIGVLLADTGADGLMPVVLRR